MVAGIGKALGQGLTRSLAKGVGVAGAGKAASAGKATGRGVAKKAGKAKAVENVRQASIIEAQKAKEKISKKQGFKKALKEAKTKGQKTFTYDGYRFTVANY